MESGSSIPGWARVTIALSFGVTIAAQGSTPPRREPVTVGTTTLDVYSESTSRELFSACDRDSDDRLDLFEACDALETLGDPEDSRSFLALDSNRDGFVQWPEFDAHYRGAIDRNGTFRVRTCRRFVQQSPELQEARSSTPLEVFLKLNDANSNGGLDPDEIAKLVRDVGLLPVFEAQLKRLDLDNSGRIEPVELQPWFDQIRKVVTLPGVSELPTPSTMPPPWGSIDGNGDATIDLDEITAALRRLDQGLPRWAGLILKNLDRNGDGKLSGIELPTTTSPTATPQSRATNPSSNSNATNAGSGAAALLGALRRARD